VTGNVIVDIIKIEISVKKLTFQETLTYHQIEEIGNVIVDTHKIEMNVKKYMFRIMHILTEIVGLAIYDIEKV
jgi:hypothetical protein